MRVYYLYKLCHHVQSILPFSVNQHSNRPHSTEGMWHWMKCPLCLSSSVSVVCFWPQRSAHRVLPGFMHHCERLAIGWWSVQSPLLGPCLSPSLPPNDTHSRTWGIVPGAVGWWREPPLLKVSASKCWYTLQIWPNPVMKDNYISQSRDPTGHTLQTTDSHVNLHSLYSATGMSPGTWK